MIDVTFDAFENSVLFLGVAVIVFLYIALFRYKEKSILLRSKHVTLSKRTFYLKVLLIALVWAFLSITAMKPVHESETGKIVEETKPFDEVVFVVDTSESMLAKDSRNQSPRFLRAKEIIQEIVSLLGGVNISLVAFSSTSELVVPPTEDYLYFQILLDDLQINQPGTTGSDFLALSEYLKNNLKSSAFSKSTLFVLFTDGEDTLGSGSVPLILENVRALKDAQVTAVALGSENGTELSGVEYQGKEVRSFMQKEFLQKLVTAGGGHLFIDRNMPLLSLVDSLSADILSRKGSRQEVTVKSEKRPNIFPVIAAFIFLLLVLFLPKRSIKQALFCFAFLPLSLFADVEETIDIALVFNEAGRSDIAETMLQKLLNDSISPYERITILYNIATFQAQNLDYARAVKSFDRMDASELQRVKKESPLLYASISYNNALSHFLLAKAQVEENPFQARDLLQVATFLGLEAKKTLADTYQEFPFSSITFLFENIRVLEEALQKEKTISTIDQLGKQELMQYLRDVIDTVLLSISVYKNEPHGEVYRRHEVEKHAFVLKIGIDRTVFFLQVAPSKASSVLRDFLARELLLKEEDLLLNLEKLKYLLYVIEQEGIGKDVEALLAYPGNSEYQKGISEAYIALKGEVSDGIERRKLESVLSYLKESQSTEDAFAYWNVLQTPYRELYLELLQNDKKIALVIKKLQALDEPKDSITFLKEAERQNLYRFNVFKSWYEVSPEDALTFLSFLMQQNIKNIPVGGDISFLYELVKELVAKRPDILEIRDHLKEKRAPQTIGEEFDLYITVFWLTHWFLLDDVIKEPTAKLLSQEISAAMSLQRDLQIAFTRANESLEWGWNLQKRLVDKIQLAAKPFAAVDTLLNKALDLLQKKPTEKRSEKVYRLLEEAKKLLEEPEESDDDSKEEQKKEDFKEFETKSLSLSPEKSIRLLQEMYREDNELFDKKVQVRRGIRPW